MARAIGDDGGGRSEGSGIGCALRANAPRRLAQRLYRSLLGVDIEHLSAADGLRVDMISALRLVIDSEQATVLAGGQADLGKLNVAVQSLIALLPNRELPVSAANRVDPRQIMFETYMAMRKRGAAFGQGYDGLKLENEKLKARIAELEATAAPAPDEPSATPPAPAAPSNVVPLPPKPPSNPVTLLPPEPWRPFSHLYE